jgi:hypothetical protein
MEAESAKNSLLRPVISDYEDPVDFLKEMIDYRKKTEKTFSVHAVAATLRKVSPTLV